MRTIGSADEWASVAAGEAVICGYASACSACIGQGEHREYPAGDVILAVITRRGNIGRPGFWHGWWSCPDHWARGAIRSRLFRTGSVTP